jgi:hypothetical protein
MLDILAGLFIGAYWMALVRVIAWTPSRPIADRIAFTAVFVAWLLAIIALANVGAFRPGVLGPIPAGLGVFTVVLVPLLLMWRSRGRIRDALMAIDAALLIGLHAFRLGGVFFVVLGLTGHLGLSFALPAGIGDVVAGGAALALSLRYALGYRVSARTLRAWNTFAALDLVVAIGTAALASPVGFGGSGPGTRMMATLPWILVPALIVPVLFLTHIVIAARLRSSSRHDSEPAFANA